MITPSRPPIHVAALVTTRPARCGCRWHFYLPPDPAAVRAWWDGGSKGPPPGLRPAYVCVEPAT